MFQRRLYQAIGDLKGILNIIDDVLLYGVVETKEEATKDHDRKLLAFLEWCQAIGIRLNHKKMLLKLSQVRFMGHLVTDTGVLPDPDKVSAIRNMHQLTFTVYIAYVEHWTLSLILSRH